MPFTRSRACCSRTPDLRRSPLTCCFSSRSLRSLCPQRRCCSNGRSDMTSLRHTLHVLLLAAALCKGSVAAAQDRIALHLDAAIRDAALCGTVQNPVPQAAAGQNKQSLTLADATELALAHNLDIAVERLNAPAVDFQFAGLKASYLPTVT